MKAVSVSDLHIRGRIDGFDGLRAIATLIVVLVHMQLLNKVGWVAVQEFFLMSGFLISRVLLDLKTRFSVGRFFAEFLTFRVLRIFPAYFAYVILVAIGARLFAPGLWAEMAGQLKYLCTFVFNFAWLWDPQFRSPWAAHLWSLSVEEQFYLIWPWIILFTPLHRLKQVLLAIVAAGPFLRGAILYWANRHAAEHGMDPGAVIYLVTPSYLDVFAMGALLCFNDVRRALASIPNPMYFALLLGAIALGIVVNGVAHGFDSTIFYSLGYPVLLPNGYQALWGYSLVSVLMMVLLAKVTEQGFGKRLFTIPLLDRVGKVAYSMYLWHHGLIILIGSLPAAWLVSHLHVRPYVATLIWAPLYFVVLYLVSNAAYEWFEQPPMKLRRKLFGGRTTAETTARAEADAKPASKPA